MRKLLIFVLIVSLCTPVNAQLFNELEEELLLFVGQTKVIEADNPQRIAVGKPEVADIAKVTEENITIVARSKGQTTLVWWDQFGEHTLAIKVYLEDVVRLKERIDRLLKEAEITGIITKAIQGEDKLLLLGEVKDAAAKQQIDLVLGELKAKTTDLLTIREEEASVDIEVHILELSQDASKELGVDWSWTSIGLTEHDRSDFDLATFPQAVSQVDQWKRSPFTAKLDFLITEGKAKVLSRPRLVCRSGKEADLLVGGEVPILSTEVASAGGEGTQIEYKEFGINLTIKPTVVGEKTIDLVVKAEVSEVDLANVSTLGSAEAPTAKAFPLSKRNVSTELTLQDGQTLSIGGLITEKASEDYKKVPWLADVPILGPFFRHKSASEGGGSGQRGDTELFITLTPRNIRVPDDKVAAIETAKGPTKRKHDVFGSYEELRIPDELKEYIFNVQQQIVNNISYPPVLVNTGWEANLVLAIKLSSVGELREAKVIRPSGYRIFDDQALDIVRTLTYPAFPSHVRLDEISIEVPIVYRAQN